MATDGTAVHRSAAHGPIAYRLTAQGMAAYGSEASDGR